MALFDYAVRIESRFSCPTPESAAPKYKADHQLPQVYDARTPHAYLDLRLTTSGSAIDRTNVNYYEAHCPDAPVLIGKTQQAAYADGLAHTAAGSRHRLLAVAGAALVGAAAGVVMAAAGIGLVALGAYLGLTTAVASWPLFGMLVLINSTFDASFCAGLEWQGWRALHHQLRGLVALCEVAERSPHAGANLGAQAADEARVEAAIASDDWVLQQAGLELLAWTEGDAETKQAA